ncbi:MAG: ABC transporter ATP-binding protein [Rhodanobacter sp.]|uniref:ABC transporter ATP-binding protein n=1 Tax=Rhodanobacter sp. KK11 TaxID=3083255 RepID=UPI002967061A|nr:ABC transporter ATP-binding protein [Rhodanobacter sp. KK11]MDW2979931.1 ABC transporter ATP-binding protein [Rhodanobacter sp. KK11]
MDTATAHGARTGVVVENLHIAHRKRGQLIEIVRGVSLSVAVGERLALVGESGTGKSLTARSLLGLLPPPTFVSAGSIRIDGIDVVGASDAQLRRVRGGIVSFIPQDPMSALNPVRRIGRIFDEVLVRHCVVSKAERRDRIAHVLSGVGLQQVVLERFPHQLSGGMKQRVLIALALVTEPTVIVADEPTTALDATVQAEILDMLSGQLAQKVALLMITHDLGVAATVCQNIAIMYGGTIVEYGPIHSILGAPGHPYTRGLLAAAPDFDPDRPCLVPIAGSPPVAGAFPPGCAFSPRCSSVGARCQQEPALAGGDHQIACWFASRS